MNKGKNKKKETIKKKKKIMKFIERIHLGKKKNERRGKEWKKEQKKEKVRKKEIRKERIN